MIESYEIILEGNPVAWAAARVTKRGFAYSPRAKEKEQSRSILKLKWKWEMLRGPVHVFYTYIFAIPKSYSEKKKKEFLEKNFSHIKKPDIDNLDKHTSDLLSKIVIYDDSQIVSKISRKVYGSLPRTIISICPAYAL